MNLMYYHKKKNELRLDLHRAPADPFEVILERARARITRARAHQFWYHFLNQLYCHEKRGRGPQFASWLKGIKIGTLLQAASWVINLRLFLHNWHWLKMRSKLLRYFRQPAGGSILPRNEWFNEKKLGTLYLTLYINIIFFSCTLSSYFLYC